MELSGKTACVTGAASGIGLAIAQGMAELGADVYLCDINKEGGEAAAEGIRASGRKAAFAHVDVTSDESVTAFADALKGKGVAMDIVVNGAGWGRIQYFLDNPPDFWDRVIGINYVGPLRMVKAFLPGMYERKSGKIVNVSSDAGRVGSTGEAVYSGAKGAVIGFTKALARESARYGVNVNCVCPGPTDTPLLAQVPEKHREAFRNAIPFRRFAKPSEIADAVCFFASGRSDYITGQVLSVSGGLTMV